MNQRCHACGADYEPGVERDPCLGPVPGAYSACCGHGNVEHALILFGSNPGVCERRMTGQSAIEHFDELRHLGLLGW